MMQEEGEEGEDGFEKARSAKEKKKVCISSCLGTMHSPLCERKRSDGGSLHTGDALSTQRGYNMRGLYTCGGFMYHTVISKPVMCQCPERVFPQMCLPVRPVCCSYWHW